MTDFELGVQSYIDKKFVDAEKYFRLALNTEPENFVIHHNLGVVYIQLNQNVKAIEHLNYSCNSGYIESFISRGAANRNLGFHQKALSDFAMAFSLKPDHATAYSNYSNVLREFGQLDLALDFIKIAQKYNTNNDTTIHLNESITYLSLGDFTEGWKKYNYRWFYETGSSLKPNLAGPEFDGSQEIKNKKVFVYSEQGFGDCVQFSRFLHLLTDNGAQVTFLSKKPLTELFKFNFPKIKVLDWDEQIPEYNYHVALLDLPKCFNTTIDNIPYCNGYLSVGEQNKFDWKEFLGEKTKLRIGINWTSNGAAYNTKFRKIDLSHFNQLVSDDYDFISLNFEPTDREINLLAQLQIKNYYSKLGNFYNTAGLISNLDCVITVDTVSAHLAGAMGVPTYVLLPDYGCDWRWFQNRTDSPFYSSVKLFQKSKNWDETFKQIKTHLNYLG